MSIDPREWEKRSESGELCGMLGCNNPPTIQCAQCKTHYCVMSIKLFTDIHSNNISCHITWFMYFLTYDEIPFD